MNTRTTNLTRIRPEVSSVTFNEQMSCDERFQNQTLRAGNQTAKRTAN